MAAVRVHVGLQHVAIEVDGAFAQRFQVEHRAQRAANQALDFLGAAALLAPGSLAVTAGVGGAGQHAVLGRDPALAAALLVAGHLFLHGSGAQHAGIAKFDQHRALGMDGVAPGDAHRAQLVGGTLAAADEGRHG